MKKLELNLYFASVAFIGLFMRDLNNNRALTLILVTSLIIGQLLFKRSKLLLVLLILEGLTLVVLYFWIKLSPGLALPPQDILRYFLAAVSEACLALACLVALVRSHGRAALTE